MEKPLLDRWTDTATFRFLLFCSGVLVMPVLALGVLTTVIGGGVLVTQPTAFGLEQLAFGLLSAGGMLGLVGYVRAHLGAKNPTGHNITATLLCLGAGVVTALAVTSFAVVGSLDGLRSPWGAPAWIAVTTVFAAANLAWVISGIAWMQRLPHRYAVRTGRSFDGLPALLLFVALALAIVAATIATTL
jgi:hypothetical protein